MEAIRRACDRYTTYADLVREFHEIKQAATLRRADAVPIIMQSRSFCVAGAMYAVFGVDLSTEQIIALYRAQTGTARFQDIATYLARIRDVVNAAEVCIRLLHDDNDVEAVARILVGGMDANQLVNFYDQLSFRLEHRYDDLLRRELQTLPGSPGKDSALAILAVPRVVIITYKEDATEPVETWQYNTSAQTMLAVPTTNADVATGFTVYVSAKKVFGVELDARQIVVEQQGHSAEMTAFAVAHLLDVVHKRLFPTRTVRVFCAADVQAHLLTHTPKLTACTAEATGVLSERIVPRAMYDVHVPLFAFVCGKDLAPLSLHRFVANGVAVQEAPLAPTFDNRQFIEEIVTDPNGLLCKRSPSTFAARDMFSVHRRALKYLSYVFLLINSYDSVVGYCTMSCVEPGEQNVEQLCVGVPMGLVSTYQTAGSFLTWILSYLRAAGEHRRVTAGAVDVFCNFYAKQGFYKLPSGMLAYDLEAVQTVSVGFVVVEPASAFVQMYICDAPGAPGRLVPTTAHVVARVDALLAEARHTYPSVPSAPRYVIMVSKQCEILGLAALLARPHKFVVGMSTTASNGVMVQTMLVPFVTSLEAPPAPSPPSLPPSPYIDRRRVVVLYQADAASALHAWQPHTHAGLMLACLPTAVQETLYYQMSCAFLVLVADYVGCTAAALDGFTLTVQRASLPADVTAVAAAHLLQVVHQFVAPRDKVAVECDREVAEYLLVHAPRRSMVTRDGDTLVSQRVVPPAVYDASAPLFALVCDTDRLPLQMFRFSGRGVANLEQSDFQLALLSMDLLFTEIFEDPNGVLCNNGPDTTDGRAQLFAAEDNDNSTLFWFVLLNADSTVVGYCIATLSTRTTVYITRLCVGVPMGTVSPLQSGESFLVWILLFLQQQRKYGSVELTPTDSSKHFYARLGFFDYGPGTLLYQLEAAPASLTLPVGFLDVVPGTAVVHTYVCDAPGGRFRAVPTTGHVTKKLERLLTKARSKYEELPSAPRYVIMVSKQCEIWGLAALRGQPRRFDVGVSTNAVEGQMVRTVLVPFLKALLAPPRPMSPPRGVKRGR